MAKVVKKARGNGNIIVTDVAGAIGTIPTVENHTMEGWLDTDLYEGETLINISNVSNPKPYMRIGDVIYMAINLTIAPTFFVDDITDVFDDNTTGNVLSITGSGFTGVTFGLEQGEPILENVSFDVIDDNNIEITFDIIDIPDENGNEIEYPIINLTKNGYSYSSAISINNVLPFGFLDYLISEIEANSNVQLDIPLNREITNFENFEIDNPFGNVVVNDYAIDGEQVYAMLDTSNAVGEETFRIRVTADGETTEWSHDIMVAV